VLPKPIETLAEKFRLFQGVGLRSSQKLSLEVLQLNPEEYTSLLSSLQETRNKVKFCQNCGFFAEENLGQKIECEICKDKTRNSFQICLVENPTDIITMERGEIYRGLYCVLENLISPLDNIFAEDTTLDNLFTTRLPALINSSQFKFLEENGSLLKNKIGQNQSTKIELILFFKAGFAAEATTAYLKELVISRGWSDKILITRLAQGLPLYYNPDTLDQATVVKAIEDRRLVY